MFHISVKIFPIELIYMKRESKAKKSKKKNYAGTPANSLAKDRGCMQTSSIRWVRDLHGPVRCGCGQPGCLPGSALLWRQDLRPRMERKGTVARSLGHREKRWDSDALWLTHFEGWRWHRDWRVERISKERVLTCREIAFFGPFVPLGVLAVALD